MLENTENQVSPEDTIPLANTHDDEPADAEKEGTPQPEGEETPAAESDVDDGEKTSSSTDDFSLPVRFNHADRNLNLEEATKYAQLGLKFENKGFEKVYKRLDYLAAQSGVSVENLVESLITQSEDNYRTELESKFGDDKDTIESLMKVYHDRNKERYDAVIADREKAELEKTESINAKIAEDFIALQAEFPEYAKFSDLPESVKKAAFSGNDLTKELLLYRHKENKNIAEQQRAAAQAAKSSTGSHSSKEGTFETSADQAFLNGVFGR